MKRFLVIILVLGCSLACASWQQNEIRRIRSEIDRLASELEKTHLSLKEGQARLAVLEQHLQKLRVLAQSQAGALSITDFILPPGPEQEGWWPSNQPYFYLNKQLLPLVRLEDINQTPDEVRASGAEFESNTDYSIENRLFSNNQLSRQMVMLLGLTDAERAAVEQVYEELTCSVRAIERTKIQKIDPPQPVDNSRVMIARLPSLAEDINPLLENAQLSIQNILVCRPRGIIVSAGTAVLQSLLRRSWFGK